MTETTLLPSPEQIDLVIYHADCYDGAGAAWAAWRRLGNNAEYIAKQHGEDPWTIDYTGRNIAIVDFSWSLEVLEKIRSVANSLIVLDHHEGAKTALKDWPFMIFDQSRSGAGITWEWFHGSEPLPEILAHIQDRDIRAWKLEGTKRVVAYLGLEAPSIERVEFVHNKLQGEERENILLIGETIASFQTQKTTQKAAKMKEGTLVCPDGSEYPCFVLNTTSPSEVCNKALARDPERIAIGWFYDYEHGFFRVSLRSDDTRPNVNEIASKFGGGGHRNASGFRFDGDIRNLVRV